MPLISGLGSFCRACEISGEDFESEVQSPGFVATTGGVMARACNAAADIPNKRQRLLCIQELNDVEACKLTASRKLFRNWRLRGIRFRPGSLEV